MSKERDEVTFEEQTRETLEQYFIYFHKLPVGNVIKIGHSQIAKGNYHLRTKEAQRYFVENVECLGIELCESKTVASRKETQLKRTFGVARQNSELLNDEPAVRDYISKHCDADVNFVAEMSHIAEIQRNRKR